MAETTSSQEKLNTVAGYILDIQVKLLKTVLKKRKCLINEEYRTLSTPKKETLAPFRTGQ